MNSTLLEIAFGIVVTEMNWNQMYQQNPEFADKYKFWASKCTPGMEMRKIHTGLPALIVRTISEIVLTDMNDFEFAESSNAKFGMRLRTRRIIISLKKSSRH